MSFVEKDHKQCLELYCSMVSYMATNPNKSHSLSTPKEKSLAMQRHATPLRREAPFPLATSNELVHDHLSGQLPAGVFAFLL